MQAKTPRLELMGFIRDWGLVNGSTWSQLHFQLDVVWPDSKSNNAAAGEHRVRKDNSLMFQEQRVFLTFRNNIFKGCNYFLGFLNSN